MLGVVEAIPIIGQGISLIEMGVKNSLKGRATLISPDHPETSDIVGVFKQAQAKGTYNQPPTFDQEIVTQKVVNNFSKISPRFKLEKNVQNGDYQVKLLFKDEAERNAATINLKFLGITIEDGQLGDKSITLENFQTDQLAGFPKEVTKENKEAVYESLQASTSSIPSTSLQARVTQEVLNKFSAVSPRFRVEKNEKDDYHKENDYSVKFLFKDEAEGLKGMGYVTGSDSVVTKDHSIEEWQVGKKEESSGSKLSHTTFEYLTLRNFQTDLLAGFSKDVNKKDKEAVYQSLQPIPSTSLFYFFKSILGDHPINPKVDDKHTCANRVESLLFRISEEFELPHGAQGYQVAFKFPIDQKSTLEKAFKALPPSDHTITESGSDIKITLSSEQTRRLVGFAPERVDSDPDEIWTVTYESVMRVLGDRYNL